VLAGVNGAGKSSLGGAMIRASESEYFNPDEAARRARETDPTLGVAEANSAAWHQGKRLLVRAIEERGDFAFETTLGGSTIPALLADAASRGLQVHVWYAGLSSPGLHLRRIRARVARGGHDIPEEDVRRRWGTSRLNLVRLLPALTELHVYDNSADADPVTGALPEPRLVLHLKGNRVVAPSDLADTPEWAKPIVAAAIRVGGLGRTRLR